MIGGKLGRMIPDDSLLAKDNGLDTAYYYSSSCSTQEITSSLIDITVYFHFDVCVYPLNLT